MNISLKLTLFFVCVTIHSGWAQSAAEEKAVLDVVHRFFDALEQQDTVVMNKIYLTTAYNYYVREQNGVVRAGGRPHANTGLKPGQVVKERMRSSGVSVKIHNRIAMVWAPYDFWVNDQLVFSLRCRRVHPDKR